MFLSDGFVCPNPAVEALSQTLPARALCPAARSLLSAELHTSPLCPPSHAPLFGTGPKIWPLADGASDGALLQVGKPPRRHRRWASITDLIVWRGLSAMTGLRSGGTHTYLAVRGWLPNGYRTQHMGAETSCGTPSQSESQNRGKRQFSICRPDRFDLVLGLQALCSTFW